MSMIPRRTNHGAHSNFLERKPGTRIKHSLGRAINRAAAGAGEVIPKNPPLDPSQEAEFRRILNLDMVRELQNGTTSQYMKRKLRYRIACYLRDRGLIAQSWFEKLIGGLLVLSLFLPLS